MIEKLYEEIDGVDYSLLRFVDNNGKDVDDLTDEDWDDAPIYKTVVDFTDYEMNEVFKYVPNLRKVETKRIIDDTDSENPKYFGSQHILAFKIFDEWIYALLYFEGKYIDPCNLNPYKTTKFYKCDTFEGFLQLLEDNKEFLKAEFPRKNKKLFLKKLYNI